MFQWFKKKPEVPQPQQPQQNSTFELSEYEGVVSIRLFPANNGTIVEVTQNKTGSPAIGFSSKPNTKEIYVFGSEVDIRAKISEIIELKK